MITHIKLPTRWLAALMFPCVALMTATLASCEKKTKSEKVAEEVDEAINSDSGDELRENIGDAIKEAAKPEE